MRPTATADRANRERVREARGNGAQRRRRGRGRGSQICLQPPCTVRVCVYMFFSAAVHKRGTKGETVNVRFVWVLASTRGGTAHAAQVSDEKRGKGKKVVCVCLWHWPPRVGPVATTHSQARHSSSSRELHEEGEGVSEGGVEGRGKECINGTGEGNKVQRVPHITDTRSGPSPRAHIHLPLSALSTSFGHHLLPSSTL